VGILFIIFDLEIMYIFSWVISWWFLNFFGICIMFLFLLLLIVGFIYELFLGAIDLYFLRSKFLFRNLITTYANY
jgi:NADH-quinone oxidoreductase subunit A